MAFVNKASNASEVETDFRYSWDLVASGRHHFNAELEPNLHDFDVSAARARLEALLDPPEEFRPQNVMTEVDVSLFKSVRVALYTFKTTTVFEKLSDVPGPLQINSALVRRFSRMAKREMSMFVTIQVTDPTEALATVISYLKGERELLPTHHANPLDMIHIAVFGAKWEIPVVEALALTWIHHFLYELGRCFKDTLLSVIWEMTSIVPSAGIRRITLASTLMYFKRLITDRYPIPLTEFRLLHREKAFVRGSALPKIVDISPNQWFHAIHSELKNSESDET